jgi:hypothetical protein
MPPTYSITLSSTKTVSCCVCGQVVTDDTLERHAPSGERTVGIAADPKLAG